MKILKNLIKFLKLFYQSYLSFKGNKYSFAFIVHPRDLKDARREFPFFKYFPNKTLNLFINILPPLIVSEITGLKSLNSNKDIKGCMISINLLPKDMLNKRKLAIQKIIKSINIAKKRGVKIIGLGGLTSSVTRGGLDLLDKVSNVHITTGHAYTALNITTILKSIVDNFNLNKERLIISIVGAAGSIGSSCTQILTQEEFKNFILIDVERKLKRIKELLIPELKKMKSDLNILDITNDISKIKNSHFIITATNAPETIIKPEHLSSGTIILDDAQPSDVDVSVLEIEDIIVIEAGLTHTPGIHTHFNFGFRDKYDNYSCLAEIMILSAIGYEKHFVIHRADLKAVSQIKEWSEKLGFRPAELQNFKEVINKNKLNKVIDLIKKRINNIF